MGAGARGVAAVCVVFAAGLLARADDDPVQGGKKFSEWKEIVQTDKSARQRSLAVQALGRIWTENPKTEALSFVTQALRTDASAPVRAQCAIVLGGLKEADLEKYAAKTLIDVLASEKESRVRKELVAAVGKYPAVAGTAVPALVPCLNDPDPGVRSAAADALAATGAKAKSAAGALTELLKDDDAAVRVAAVFALGRVQPEAATTIAETLAAMLAREKEPNVRRELFAALRLLNERSGPVVTALAEALTDKDDDARRAAVQTLLAFGTDAEPVADALFRAAGADPLKGVRVEALRAFARAVGPDGVKKRLNDVRAMLDPDNKERWQPDFEVRVALIDELAALGYEHLGTDLTSTDPVLKGEALATMKTLRLRQTDPQLRVRQAATDALRKIEKKPELKKNPADKG